MKDILNEYSSQRGWMIPEIRVLKFRWVSLLRAVGCDADQPRWQAIYRVVPYSGTLAEAAIDDALQKPFQVLMNLVCGCRTKNEARNIFNMMRVRKQVYSL